MFFYEDVINLDTDPIIPENKKRIGWKIKTHKKGGQFKWDPTKLEFFVDESQYKRPHGRDLLETLTNQPTANANLLDFLIKYPFLIPDEWKEDESGYGRTIFFWGTVYSNYHTDPEIRYLQWDEEEGI